MLRACVMDFVGSWDAKLHLMEFSYNNNFQATIGMIPFEVSYGKRCRSPLCWNEVGERELVGLEVVQKIRARMRTVQSRQKSYNDVMRRNLEFEEGDPVFLKVAPMKGILRFGRKGKLSPCFIGPFKILDRIGSIAYKLAHHLHSRAYTMCSMCPC